MIQNETIHPIEIDTAAELRAIARMAEELPNRGRKKTPPFWPHSAG